MSISTRHGNGDGFIDYNDAATASTPITLLAGVWTTLTNDGLGSFSNDTYKPPGITRLLNVSTGAIDPTELRLGDVLHIRNDFTVTPSVNNTLLEFRYQLGTGGSTYTLQKTIGRLDSGSGIPYPFSALEDQIYMGDTNTRDNPIVIQIRCTSPATVINAGTVIQLERRT